MPKENVLAVPADSDFFRSIRPGYRSEFGMELKFDSLPTLFIPRPECETDENYRQLIPYIIVNVLDRGTVAYRRKGDEKRLHGDLSIGFGGHVAELDCWPAHDAIHVGTMRELAEELPGLTPQMIERVKWCGYLRDDSNPVGRVHLGLVGRLDIIPSKDKDIELSEGDFAGCHPGRDLALPGMVTLFESWSRILIDQAPQLLY